MKKLLSLVLVLVLVLTSMTVAFAAVPSDVKDTDYEGAVTRLVALGVIKGRPDGTFAPNDSISRAEFAAVIVRALGYESVAEVAIGRAPRYADVTANFWANGYINIATSLGVIKGRPDGNFGPNDPVLFEEAVTMIVRALGMEAFADAKGGYPSGYLMVGNDVGFTKDVKCVAGIPALRGIVAQLVDNAKTKDIYVQKGFGDSQVYEPSEENFMTKLGMERIAGKVVTSVPSVSDLDDNEFVASGKTYEAIEGAVDFDSILGKKVDIWANSDGEVVLAEVKAGDIVAVKEVKSITKVDGEVTKVKVKNTDNKEKEYTVNAAAGAVYNLLVSDVTDLFDEIDATDYKESYALTLTVDGSSLLFANGLVFDDPARLTSAPAVNKVKDFIRISFVGGSFLLRDDGDDVAKYVIIKNGKEVDYKDLAKNDIIHVAKNLAGDGDITDDRYYIIATSDVVTGTLQRATKTITNPESVTVDKVAYDFSVFNADNNLAGLGIEIGGTVKLVLDRFGKIFEISEVEDDKTPDTFGIITAFDEQTSFGESTYKVKVFSSEGDTLTYVLADNEDTADYLELADKTDVFVKYHINEDGEIDAVELAADVNLDKVINVDKGTFTSGGVTRYGVEDIVVFNYDGSKYAVWDWAKLNDGSATVASWVLDSGEVVAVLFSEADLAGTAKYALVTDMYAIKNAYAIEMITADGEKTFNTVNRSVYGEPGRVVTYTINSVGKASDITALDADESGDLQEVSSRRIKLGGEYYYFTADSMIFFDEDNDGADVEVLTKADLYKDMVIDLYLDGSGDIAVIVVTEM